MIVGLRPQQLRLDAGGNTHRVELTEALGGVSFVHLTAPSGEKLVIEAHDDLTIKPGTMVGVSFDAADAMFFAADADAVALSCAKPTSNRKNAFGRALRPRPSGVGVRETGRGPDRYVRPCSGGRTRLFQIPDGFCHAPTAACGRRGTCHSRPAQGHGQPIRVDRKQSIPLPQALHPAARLQGISGCHLSGETRLQPPAPAGNWWIFRSGCRLCRTSRCVCRQSGLCSASHHAGNSPKAWVSGSTAP